MFCRIYLSENNTDENSVLYELSKVLSLKVKGSYIEDENYSVSIDLNEEFDEKKQKEFPDGFLYFRFLIEFESNDKIALVSAISKALRFYWSNNLHAIASCNFEKLLPEKGGYNNLNIPWLI